MESWENQSEHGFSAVFMDHSYKDKFPWNYIIGAQNLPDTSVNREHLPVTLGF